MSQDFIQLCKDKGISPSFTRKRIFEYLEEHKNHPTVDQIYQALSSELPTLSKTTVYNVLSLFIEEEIVQSINTSSNEKRYEIIISDHAHFTCKVCQKIFDIPKVHTSYDSAAFLGFLVEREEVNFVGICPNCMNQHNS